MANFLSSRAAHQEASCLIHDNSVQVSCVICKVINGKSLALRREAHVPLLTALARTEHDSVCSAVECYFHGDANNDMATSGIGLVDKSGRAIVDAESQLIGYVR